MILKVLKPLIEKFPKVAAIYRPARDSKALSTPPEMTPLGFKFNGNKAMESAAFEPYETGLVKKIFSKVDVVVNVGANIGYYVCLALQENKKVIAFEPIELNLRYLLRNVKANDWQRQCEVFPMALSNEVGVIEIYGGGTGASLLKGWAGTPDNYSTLVPCSTMDIVLGERLVGKKVFVIMDIEGAENMALEGAAKLLDMMPRPIWLVEIAGEVHLPKGEKISDSLLKTFDFFWSRGYESVTADEHMRPIDKLEIEKIILTQVNTLGTCNFIFHDRCGGFI
jgi:FkbM family methyltransferase